MPEVVLRTGTDPDEPDELLLAVIIDPEGSPGEQAVLELGDRSAVDEDEGVCYVQQTDAWADARVEDGVVTVDILIYDAVLEHRGVDVSAFPERSPRDPDAVRVLRATGTTTHDTLPNVTLVYTSPLDELEEDELPLLFAPPPKPPEVVLRAGLNPDDPEAVRLAVVIDPQESLGEWAIAKIGEHCDVDEENHVSRTDAWAERRLENGELTVDIVVREARLRRFDDVDATVFEERSPRDPNAVRVLRVTGTTTHDTLPDETLVYLTPLDQLDEDDRPLVLAPPPEA
jgi:hypothetical protein